ncbi:hypothetical protein Pst134EA_007120 [Puccinia striiformis f. sp. tritici]|uniref:hypothetical protein n=1 Tax=Puccinia striiformis f. sp. tritici TaxID=168172 RepID=UPI0020074A78|nr:hypothetical protein Pst134EA_007120 [Puccinia striiformis f. sp. tritici]KAH9469844.1 hypothetical protein Pst134EA_007120 [Puccinia striiformis f. sp. tritici]KAI9608560.1 hypothetical protein H4Q26_004743 [Puccinia striiformis f. sp. tritici PST-130]
MTIHRDRRNGTLWLYRFQAILFMTAAVVSGALMRGISASPAASEVRDGTSKEEIIQKYETFFPYLTERQRRLETKPAELAMISDRTEWKQARRSPAKDFKRLRGDMEALANDLPNEPKLKRQQKHHALSLKFNGLQGIHALLSPNIQRRLSKFPRKGDLPALAGGMLQDLLNDVDPSTYTKPWADIDKFDKRSFGLQRIIFKTVYYLFRHGEITREQYVDFFRNKNNMELAAINMIASFKLEYSSHSFYPKYPRSQYILSNDYSSHLWPLFPLLKENERRKFIYDSERSVIIYHNSYTQSIEKELVDSFFNNNKFFNALEQHHIKNFTSNIKKNGDLRNQESDWIARQKDLDKMINLDKNEDPDQNKKLIQEHLDKIVKCFDESRNLKGENEGKLMTSFLLSNFIKENYGDNILQGDHEASKSFNDGFHLVSSTFQFLEKISYIQEFIDHSSDLLQTSKIKDTRKRYHDLKLLKSYVRILFQENNNFKNTYLNLDSLNRVYVQQWESMDKKLHLMVSISSIKNRIKPVDLKVTKTS